MVVLCLGELAVLGLMGTLDRSDASSASSRGFDTGTGVIDSARLSIAPSVVHGASILAGASAAEVALVAKMRGFNLRGLQVRGLQVRSLRRSQYHTASGIWVCAL